jgi:hypothetical protein
MRDDVMRDDVRGDDVRAGRIPCAFAPDWRGAPALPM